MNSAPLVYALMPTTPERDWIRPLAIKAFQKQTYPNLRLLIGLDEKGTRVPPGEDVLDQRIETVVLGPSPTVGVKYNLMHAEANKRGAEYISLFPDDDWQAPDYTSKRMELLLGSGLDRVGCQRMLFYEVATDTVRLFEDKDHPKSRPWWVAHGSLIMHRSVWERTSGYPNKQPGTDSAFQDLLKDTRPAYCEATGYVAVQHGTNTYSDMNWGSPTWRNLTAEGVTLESNTMLGADAAEWRKAWKSRPPGYCRGGGYKIQLSTAERISGMTQCRECGWVVPFEGAIVARHSAEFLKGKNTTHVTMDGHS